MLTWMIALDAHALDLVAPHGLKQGHVATFTVTGGTPGRTVALAYGGAPPGPCLPVLGGACLSVSNPVLVDTAVVGADGAATLEAMVPANAPLVDVRFQAAEPGAVSRVQTVPVLTRLAGYQPVYDAARLDLVRRVWRFDDELAFEAGPYGAAVELPHLEEAGTVFVNGETREVSLPRLRVTDRVSISQAPGATVSAPSLVGPDTLAGTSLEVFFDTGPVVLEAPALVDVGYVLVMGNTAAVTIDAPSAVLDGPYEGLDLYLNSGDLAGVLPTLSSAGFVNVLGHAAPALDVLPALATVDGLTLTDSAALQSVARLGAPGLVATGAVVVRDNAALTDLSGLDLASAGSAECSGNGLLASCACEAVVTTSAAPDPAACGGNAPDTCSDDPADLCF